MSMSKKCPWSDDEMTFVIRCLLDVECRLSTNIPPDINVYLMLNLGCKPSLTFLGIGQSIFEKL